MKGLPFVLAFTAMTFVAWGAYGPLLHHGTASMGRDSLRAFVGVGIAYFFIAVLVPISILRKQGESGKWTISGTIYSLIAGAVGALGALGVILALSYGGMPVYVMPLVFGFAPIVNTLVTAWMSKTFDQISPVFVGGIVLASLGVGGVLAFKPTAPPHAQTPAGDSKTDDHDKNLKSSKHSSTSQQFVSHFVSILTQQEPTAQDPLPPVVVQPPAPEDNSPKVNATELSASLPPVITPQVEAAQPTRALATPTKTEQVNAQPPATVPPGEPQELPPVIVQPTAPVKSQPLLPTSDASKADKEANKTEPKETVEPQAASKPEVAKPQPDKSSVAVSQPPVPSKQAEKVATADQDAVAEKKSAQTATTGPTTPASNVPMIILSIVVAAVCWGSYGPMLHQGQARMGGSRLRPFTCVGLAYFVIAVAAPLAVISARTADTGSWSVGGLSWSIIAGAAGAIGALGVILAFNAGGKPYYVMPLVFGFAPVINTCISLTENGTWGLATPMFWISLAVVIAGAITVLTNAPKPQHAKPHGAPAPAAKTS